ncbi:molybdopterin synthase subunit MoaD [Halanaerobium saccharolyticum]|uniref:Molybdopterin synthase subunit MoaD n=1 Tax=Halanaerobium saccharolyticum TaxID=43595 RepID=A0A4R6LZS3_9FIRM|nr:ubiquitin-like small modifier protein 1 [Halanaerobium saccharolyticum]TDO94324.1 molybdopterin synthase subunit MoaD [Halanaerobium saccharolyticum]
MALKVKLYSLFRINLNTKSVEYELESDITITELIKKLDQDFEGYFTQKLLKKDGSIARGTIILVNGQNIFHLNKLETKVSDGDVVTLFPPSAGG